MDEPTTNYASALDDAKAEREQLRKQMAELGVRIAKLDQAIAALGVLNGTSVDIGKAVKK